MVLERLYTVDTFWQTTHDVIFMQNGIKMNKLKSLIVKMNRYDLSRANSLIANNNIRSVILEIKTRCKIVRILIFHSLSREHFQTK